MIKQIWKKYDTDGDGFLDRNETKPFIKAALANVSPELNITDELIDKTFRILDKEGKGKLS